MSKIYKVFNPINGEYTNYQTYDECVDACFEQMFAIAMHFVHDQPYTVVEITPEGYEIWRNPQGDEILSPDDIMKGIKTLADKHSLFPTSGNI